METKHTPGPWLHDDRKPINIDFHSAPYFSIGTFRNPKEDAEAKANARLIAAAPDLLAALEAFLAASDQFVADTGLKHGDAITDCAEQARAAIAKARGE